MQPPEAVSVSYARAHLSALLRRVAAGESFIITVRGQPAALLTPISDMRLADLQAGDQGRAPSHGRDAGRFTSS